MTKPGATCECKDLIHNLESCLKVHSRLYDARGHLKARGHHRARGHLRAASGGQQCHKTLQRSYHSEVGTVPPWQHEDLDAQIARSTKSTSTPPAFSLLSQSPQWLQPTWRLVNLNSRKSKCPFIMQPPPICFECSRKAPRTATALVSFQSLSSKLFITFSTSCN